MPNVNRDQTVYLVTGNPDTINVAAADWVQQRPGELGKAFDFSDRAYQLVLVDSGCTAATPTGIIAANQLAFWKDKTVYMVTNDRNQAVGQPTANAYRNQVAGIFRCAVTPGEFRYAAVLQRGPNIPVREVNAAGGIGQAVIAEAAATAAVVFEAVGGNATYQHIGIARGAGNANHVHVDVDIPNIP